MSRSLGRGSGLGLAAGSVLLASSLAHAIGGWPPMAAGLRAAGAPPQLTGALAVGWYFGSVAMAVFGLIVVRTFVALRGGREASLMPVAIVGVGYLAFGAAAFVLRRFNPHFLFFIATGALILIAARRARSSAST